MSVLLFSPLDQSIVGKVLGRQRELMRQLTRREAPISVINVLESNRGGIGYRSGIVGIGDTGGIGGIGGRGDAVFELDDFGCRLVIRAAATTTARPRVTEYGGPTASCTGVLYGEPHGTAYGGGGGGGYGGDV